MDAQFAIPQLIAPVVFQGFYCFQTPAAMRHQFLICKDTLVKLHVTQDIFRKIIFAQVNNINFIFSLFKWMFKLHFSNEQYLLGLLK